MTQEIASEQSHFLASETQKDLAFLAAIVHSSDDAILGRSLDGTIMSWNRGAEVMFGYTSAEIVGQPVRLIYPLNVCRNKTPLPPRSSVASASSTTKLSASARMVLCLTSPLASPRSKTTTAR